MDWKRRLAPTGFLLALVAALLGLNALIAGLWWFLAASLAVVVPYLIYERRRVQRLRAAGQHHEVAMTHRKWFGLGFLSGAVALFGTLVLLSAFSSFEDCGNAVAHLLGI
jgi:4-hydroxybenzoate polyprenyltransferase